MIYNDPQPTPSPCQAMQLRCALIGMPGSGKSTVGPELAQRLGVPFVDLDHRLEQHLGTTIRQFFETEGEARFRDEEAAVLASTVAMPGGMVLSTGGGAVLRPENRDALLHFGNVLYLRASPQDIYERIKHDSTRPLLQVSNPMDKLREMHRARDPLYRETANFVFDTGRPTVQALVNMALLQLDAAAPTKT